MKTSRIILSIALLATATANKAAAQSIDDGLRMSQEYPTGTARFVSMGGAFGALGSDFSSIDVNPAGLGVYRSSEFTFTPSFSSTKSRSTYLGTRAIETARGFSLDNMGFVLSTSPSGNPEQGVSQLNFSFGYNRSNTFKANTLVKGRSEESSILDYFAAQAGTYNDIAPEDLSFGYDNTGAMDWDPTNTVAPWGMILAWNTYLLDDNGSNYFAPLDKTLGTVEQKRRSETSGNNGTYNLSMGMSIANKLYLGLSMGILTHKHEELINHQEDADILNNPSSYIKFNYMDYIRDFSSSGSGINAKLGAIFTPIPMLRFGLSVHTPTFYSVTHRYSYNMTSNVDTTGDNGVTWVKNINFKLDNDQLSSFTGRYKYKFETPFRLIGSAAVVLGQLGLVSVDVEHVNYSSMKFRNGEDGDDLSDLNEMAKETYRNVFNLKLGGEMVLDNVALRAGYAFYPSPYRKEFLNHNSHSHLMSIGAGYCTNIGFFIDAAYQQALSVNQYRLYEWTDEANGIDVYSAPVKSNYSTGKFVLTCGFRF